MSGIYFYKKILVRCEDYFLSVLFSLDESFFFN